MSSLPAGIRDQRRFLRRETLRVVAYSWIVLASVAYLIDLSGQLRPGWTNGSGRPLGDDFINYWSGARLAWLGRASEVYDFAAFHRIQQQLTAPDLNYYHYSYPPVLLLLTAALAAIPYIPALGLWLVASWYAFYKSLRLVVADRAALLSLATPALFVNAIGGQNGAWTAALLGGGLGLLDRRPIVSGVLFGLMIYKPHLAIVIPFALVAGRRWRATAAAALTAVVLVALSVAVFGLDLWADYLRNAGKLRVAILEDGEGVWHRMVSIFVLARHLGVDVMSAYAVQGIVGIAAIAAIVLAWWRDVAADLRNALVLVGTALATPYLQDYDMVLGAFAVVWLVRACRYGRLSPGLTAAAAGLVLVQPLFSAPLGLATGIAFGPIFMLPAFALLVGLLLQRRAVMPTPSAAAPATAAPPRW